MIGDGVLADKEIPADLTVGETMRDARQDLHLSPTETVWQRRGGIGCSTEPRDLREDECKAARLCKLDSVAEQRSCVCPISSRAARQQHARVLDHRVCEPGSRAETLVEGKRCLEMLLGTRPLAERCREHAEVAVGGALAGDEVADLDVLASVWRELRVDRCRRLGVTKGGAGVGQIGERPEPEPMSSDVETVGP